MKKPRSAVTGIAPQFLVDDLDRAVAYYRDKLGFELDFTYESFYASVSRDGCAIHLKHGHVPAEERTRRRADEHLDAYVSVEGVGVLFGELETRGAHVIQPLTQQAWSCLDFLVQDADGYILCFSEVLEEAE
ncbi:MAG: VOC family protein [Vulcanimicrobiaceae bacterium]|jgi:catechol 2,3-dioxygenase-like lactoylglutathione lyase family enzyme